jgi:predicted phage gp36 major capsid-like protein
MAVMAREGWTDERLDDLNHRVGEGFGEMRNEFRAMRAEIAQEFRAMRAETAEEFRAMRGETAEEFRAARGEMAANQRTLVQMAAGIWVTALVGFLGVIATVITQV